MGEKVRRKDPFDLSQNGFKQAACLPAISVINQAAFSIIHGCWIRERSGR